MPGRAAPRITSACSAWRSRSCPPRTLAGDSGLAGHRRLDAPVRQRLSRGGDRISVGYGLTATVPRGDPRGPGSERPHAGWMTLICPDGELAKAEPKCLRQRLQHVAAKLLRHGRQTRSSSTANGHGPTRSPPRSSACARSRRAARRTSQLRLPRKRPAPAPSPTRFRSRKASRSPNGHRLPWSHPQDQDRRHHLDNGASRLLPFRGGRRPFCVAVVDGSVELSVSELDGEREQRVRPSAGPGHGSSPTCRLRRRSLFVERALRA